MKRINRILPVVVASVFLFFPSCYETGEYTTDPRENFEALWKILDERYCFFTYKDIDWDAVHDKSSARIADSMNRYQLFDLLGLMLNELRDGHTNLVSTFDTYRFWDWNENYPDNFNAVIQRGYLGTDYNLAGGLKFRILRDSIGYAYYGSFSSPVSESNLNEMFIHFRDCKGFIFDIRGNGGGSLLYSERISSRFLTGKVTAGYIMHKTGPGHDDFSEPHAIELEPSKYIKWLRPVALLTNRSCFSAANDLVNKMKLFPHVTIIGDKTGGGCGLPFSSELPNGWGLRFSSSPILDANKEYTEFGVDPDIKVDMLESDQLNNIDTIVEEAIKLLKAKTAGKEVVTTSLEYGVR
jgi:hypothetical protein